MPTKQTPGDPLVSVEGLVKTYPLAGGEVPAIAGIDLTIAGGEFVAVVGASGSGPSGWCSSSSSSCPR